MSETTLSIIIPCFNESKTVDTVLDRIHEVELPRVEKEIIVVNDGSEDGSGKLIEAITDDEIVVHHDSNRGKGAAVRTGLQAASGSIYLIQDADLELHPADYPDLISPIISQDTFVVFGNRNRDSGQTIPLYYFGGQLLIRATQMLYQTDISDPMIGYKVFHKRVFDDITLEEDGFAFCSEFTAKVLNEGYEIEEVPVSYHPRGKKEGKKLHYTDGLQWLWVLVRERFS